MKYLGLWLILTIVMTLIVGISFADDFTVLGWTPKKAPYAEMLMKKDTREAVADLDSIVKAVPDSLEIKEQPVDSIPHSILLIGDSMTLNLAYRLSEYAKQNGHSFHAINWDSSNTLTWSGSDTLEYFMGKFDADYIFISLGSNELYLKHPDARRKNVRAILDMVGDRSYVWLGPPNWKEDAGINDMIQQECRPGTFFRTAGMQLARKKDHIHPTRPASALWIDSVARWMPRSAHPILMDIPSDSIGKVNPNVTFLKPLNK